MQSIDHFWTLTPLFSQWLSQQDVPGNQGVIFRPNLRNCRAVLLQFREWRTRYSSVTILDLGRFPDDRPWAYVENILNRSGQNPLRGLGPILNVPFLDLSHLFIPPPEGQQGVTTFALGDRYTGSGATEIVCSHLYSVSVLAHAEGLQVTGVVVNPTAEIGRIPSIAGL